MTGRTSDKVQMDADRTPETPRQQEYATEIMSTRNPYSDAVKAAENCKNTRLVVAYSAMAAVSAALLFSAWR